MFYNWLLHRLREPSTWAGIITMLTGILGWRLSEEVRVHVITLGTTLVGLLIAIGREGQPTPEDPALKKQPPAGGTPGPATGDHDRGLPSDPTSGVPPVGRRIGPGGVKDQWLHKRDPDR